MLIDCPECKKQVSDQAEACPNCGIKLKPTSQVIVKSDAAPVALAASAFGFFVALFTPKLIATLPILITLIAAAISLFRKERGRAFAGVIMVMTVGLLLLSRYPTSTSVSDNRDSTSVTPVADAVVAAEIADWNWGADKRFAGRGAVIWSVIVKNVSDRNIAAVRVQITTFDKLEKLITTDDTYVNAIPPGGTGSAKAYADYYGTEHSATIRIVDVRFAR